MGQPVSRARFVVPSLPDLGAVVRIGGDEARHARARRLGEGDAVVLVDGSGREATGTVTRLVRGAVEVRVSSVARPASDRLGPIHLLVAAVRSERLSWIAEKATELGAARLTLVSSARTQSFRASGAATSRLERVVREAAKQCDRSDWPRIAGPIPMRDAVRGERGTRLVLDAGGEPFPAALPGGPTALLVGPEGGWTEGELEAAIAEGWAAVSLAAGKLRAETAAVAALTLARTALARFPH
jgi:16S rRNA (uracil1498-N3)-methyltransferase